MAFHQQTRQPVQRVVRPEEDERDAPSLVSRPYTGQRPTDSQTWVLFSPATDVTATSYLSETEHSVQGPTRPGPGDSAIRDFVAKSDHTSALSEIDDASSEDDAELDSLDSHLPEFRSLPGVFSAPDNSNQQSTPVLPNHDGLGSFRLDQPAIGTEAQDHIYQFERFNPRRVQRRRESFDREQDRLELELEQAQVAEKRQRIEAWRLEHSRILLQEVQRETRRRRHSQASQQQQQQQQQQQPQAVSAAPKEITTDEDADAENMTWHDEDAIHTDNESDGFFATFTRKVIKDLFGLDDRTLSVLFGEDLPDEDELSATPKASQLNLASSSPSEGDESWQLQMLERVSRELGLLVNRLSQHPGAFSTYANVQQAPLPYAGLPVIPESNLTSAAAETDRDEPVSQVLIPEFRPTMNKASQPMDVPGRRPELPEDSVPDVDMGNTFTKEEWEQELDIKLVFKYLRSRFTSRPASSPAASASHMTTPNAQDMAAKAARVRQHHPLTARAHPAERRTFKAGPSSPVAIRHHSSCASQSTRRSARRSSVSSRHYWDIGGSLGTGSMIASNGPMGSWGEV
ncbi:hypothetical protein B0I35DRAFT_474638 [Stachybotrys elegans]|uniref:Uncharacterized protein n=1 Tax=Stachybotrys elegans TaxID=80388 RepID=A0A8K0SZ53_9HYPO|nr:hypothetical protein B0I35DRAFT_474638 [Stachybotrys elegans]